VPPQHAAAEPGLAAVAAVAVVVVVAVAPAVVLFPVLDLPVHVHEDDADECHPGGVRDGDERDQARPDGLLVPPVGSGRGGGGQRGRRARRRRRLRGRRDGAAGHLERVPAEPRVVEERRGALAGEGARLRDGPGEVVEAEVQRDGGREAAQLGRHDAREAVVGEVERAGEPGQLAEVGRERAVEGVGGEVELLQARHLGPHPRGELPGEGVPGEHEPLQAAAAAEVQRHLARERVPGDVQVLEARQVAERGGGEGPRQAVPVEVERVERRGVGERGRDAARQPVAVEVEAAEEEQGAQLGRDVPGDVLARHGHADDDARGRGGGGRRGVGAPDARPPARVRVGLGPPREG